MATEPTITITRALNEQGGSYDLNLVSAFTQNSIEIEYDRNGTVLDENTYLECVIDSIPFRAVKTVQGTLTEPFVFVMDLTNILPYYIGFPPTLTSGALTKLIQIQLIGYSGGLPCTDYHPDIQLCYGYPKLGDVGGMDDVAARGVSRPVYHCGQIGFYNNYGADLVEFVINGVDRTYTLAAGYNLITLHSSQLLTGNLIGGGGNLSIPVVYRPQSGSGIAWINRDGAWSIWNFRYIKKVNNTTRSNSIPLYAETNALMIGKSMDILTEKKVEYYFDTIAIDAIHYDQLTEIAESPRVLYANKICRVKKCSNQTSDCKQNLHFELILEIEENAVNY